MNEIVDSIHLRFANEHDAEMIFAWRNDPFIVEKGSMQSTVSWDEHIVWFRNSINNPRKKLFVIMKELENCGLIRFDRIKDDTCTISIYLAYKYTRKGYGRCALQKSLTKIFKEWNIKRVIACTRKENQSACSLFIKSGFVKEDGFTVWPDNHYSFVYQKKETTTLDGDI